MVYTVFNGSITSPFLRIYLFLILAARLKTSFAWVCHDKLVIPDEWRCDDSIDCLDGSDEFPENCGDKECEELQFRCNNTRCIDRSYICDGQPDCMDGDFSDEENCGCQSSEFRCKSGGTCVQKAWTCDWERDCPDGSDEWDCPCEVDAYGCKVRGITFCLKNSTKCDGIKHCDGGEDEEHCNHINSKEDSKFPCDPTRFKCRSGNECVLWKSVCDGYSDCRDDSDEGGLCHANLCNLEKSVGWLTKPKPKVACEKYCHNTPDGARCSCESGFRLSDNGTNCIDENECEEMMAERIHNYEKFSKLFVYYGMPSVCSQKCTNEPGGFRCTCVDGYMLEDDRFTCKALENADMLTRVTVLCQGNGAKVSCFPGKFNPELYVGVNNEIRVSSLRDPGDKTSYYYTIYESKHPSETILDIDLIVATSSIFWIEKESGQLLMMEDRMIAQLPIDFTPKALSVDWVTGNIYLTTSKRANQILEHPSIVLLKVSDSDLSKNNKEEKVFTITSVEILVTELKNPSAIALYPSKGIFVVADRGDSNANGRRIFIADMDGSNIRDLVSDNMFVPNDIIIDEVQNSVIWASTNGNEYPNHAVVESIRLDGTQRGVVMSREVNRFPLGSVSLDFFEDRLFISDSLAREVRSWKISKMSLYGKENAMYGSEGVIKQDHKTRLGAIKISHPLLQRPLKGGNLCEKFGCSHVCVITPTSTLGIKDLLQTVQLEAKCLCPKTYHLLNDRKTCSEKNSAIQHETATVTALLDTIPTPKIVAKVDKSGRKSTKVICSNPGRFKNTKKGPFPIHQYSEGDQFAVACEKGYRLKGKSGNKIVCMSNGKWSGLSARCVPIGKIPTGQDLQNDATTQQPGLSKPIYLDRAISQQHSGGTTQRTVLLDTISSPLEAVLKPEKLLEICVSLNCGPWGHCEKNAAESYVCNCPYGETVVSTQKPKCLPPNSNSSTETQHSLLSRNTSLMAAVIVFACILFVTFVILAWRCVRKKRYSVDLRYFRGNSSKNSRVPVDSRESVFVDRSTGGRSTSITNPNYSSPSKRRRLPRPKLCDDGSDSGFNQQSFGSESSSSTTSDSSASDRILKSPVDDPDQPTTSAPLLCNNVIPEDDELSMGDVSIGSSSKLGKAGLGERLGQLFKIRKTESRECMLPKRRKTKSSSA